MIVSRIEPPEGQVSPEFAELFDSYRQHYGQPSALAESAGWLHRNLVGGRLIGFQAEDAGKLVGFALVASMPATQRLAHFWQLRDLFVASAHRRMGVATALVRAVRHAASAGGAIRLALQTEIDNSSAIALYEGLGFERVEGYYSAILEL